MGRFFLLAIALLGAATASASPALDFGAWRGADPASYGPAFATQMRARLAGKNLEAIAADLGAQGFACRDGNRPDGRPVPALECRREVMENGCQNEWWVAVPRAGEAPLAGFDRMCLGALPTPESRRLKAKGV